MNFVDHKRFCRGLVLIRYAKGEVISVYNISPTKYEPKEPGNTHRERIFSDSFQLDFGYLECKTDISTLINLNYITLARG